MLTFKDLIKKFESKPLAGPTSPQKLNATQRKETVSVSERFVYPPENAGGLSNDVDDKLELKNVVNGTGLVKEAKSDSKEGGSKSVVSSLVSYFIGWGKSTGNKTSEQNQLKPSSTANESRGINRCSHLQSDNIHDTEKHLHLQAEAKQVYDRSTSSTTPRKSNGINGQCIPTPREDIAANIPCSKVDKRTLQDKLCSEGSLQNIAFLVGVSNTPVEHEKATSREPFRQKDSQMDRNGISKLDKTSQRIGETDTCKSTSKIPYWSLLRYEDESDSLFVSETADEKSTHHGNSFQAANNELQRPKQETAVKVSKRSAASKSTSGVYSGSMETLSRNLIQSTEDTTMNERQVKNTARYVKEVGSQLPSRRKYPSEPSSLQKQDIPYGIKATTQENVYKIGDSRFSIYSSDSESGYTESFSVSQISLLSSDQQEIRESIAEQTRQILRTHAVPSEVSRHRRLKEAKRVLDREGVVFLVSRKGSGSSHLGWDLLSLDTNTEKYNLLDVDDFQICTRSKKSATVLADDAFGMSQLENSALDKWLRHVNVSKRNRSRNVKFIFTVKHHILSQCKDKLSDYETCIVDLESQRLQLDSEEKLDVMMNLIKNNTDNLKTVLTEENVSVVKKTKSKKYAQLSKQLLSGISENASSVGFPKKFKNFLMKRENINQGLQFFTVPGEETLNEVTDMKRSKDRLDLDTFLTLAVTAIRGELKLEDVCNLGQARDECAIKRSSKTKKSKKRKSRSKEDRSDQAVEIPWRIKMISYYAQHCEDSLYESVKRGITRSKGLYVREVMKGVFDFAAPCVKNAVLLTLGKDFPQHILKVCDLPFFKDCVCSDSRFVTDKTKCVKIDVLDKVVCSEANEMLLGLHADGDIESFAKHRLFEDPMFIQQFIGSFGKNIDQLWDVIKNDRGACVISCSLANKSRSHYHLVGNFVYWVLRHKVWSQKRKRYREWTTQKEFEVIKHCCEQGQTEIYFELRRKYNIPVNFECLQLAIKSGAYAIVEDILGSIEKDLTDEEKCKSMERALLKFSRDPSNCRHDVVNALLKLASVDYKIKGVDPIIHTAAKTDDTRVFVTLKVFNGDINVTNSQGETILHEAVKRNKTAFLTMALKHGADQRKADKHGVLPIHEGAKQNKPQLIRLLMEADENIAIVTDKYGRQPLHYAAIHSSVEAANCLLEHGVEVDACDGEQKTPLHYAAESGKGTVVHSLLKGNADISKQDKDRHSPLLLACKNGNAQAVKRLLRGKELMDLNGNIPYDGMFLVHVAASRGDTKMFQLLIDAGANMNEVTLDSKDTVLHIATENGHNKLVYHILQKDDSLIDYRNKKGEVPLHIAARCGNPSVTRALLARGAERSPINKRFENPLMIVEEKLSELASQINTQEYENYYQIKMLLSGHKVLLETAL